MKRYKEFADQSNYLGQTAHDTNKHDKYCAILSMQTRNQFVSAYYVVNNNRREVSWPVKPTYPHVIFYVVNKRTLTEVGFHDFTGRLQSDGRI